MPHAIDDTARSLHQWWDQGALAPARPLLVIGGPCVLESDDLNRRIAETMKAACERGGRDVRLQGELRQGQSVEHLLGPRSRPRCRASTTRLDPGGLQRPRSDRCPRSRPGRSRSQRVVDIIQVPAFLCRQTDLSGRVRRDRDAHVAVKKGQFLSPAEMRNVLEKLRESGCTRMMATERGTFFGYHRLVNDFVGLGDLQDIAAEFKAPLCFDVTHSTQLPGGEGNMSGGRPDRAALLARAAVAAGVEAVFLETHPDPPSARSDRATVLPLEEAASLIRSLTGIREALGR